MTVSTTSTTITAIGNGVTTNFTFPFIGVSASDLVVTYTDSTGVSTVLLPTQYSVLINPVPVGGLWGVGGTVTYPLMGTPIQVGTYLSITRDVPYTQTVSIANQGAFYPKAVEQGLDLLELQIQQLDTNLLYTLKTPVTDPSPPNTLPSAALRANGVLAFDSNGQPVITTIPDITPQPGSYATPRRITTTGTATVNVLTTDSFAGISIYQNSTPVTTVQLPDGYGPYPVFDSSGNAATYPITILPPPGKTINGLTQYTIAFNYQSATFYDDGLQILVQ